jgi:hypothetical protein
MLEYMRIDATTVLNVAVLTTFALLTGSLIVSILSSGLPFRLRIDGPTLAYDQPGPRGATDNDLARLDDDGGRSQTQSPAPDPANGRVDGAGSPLPVLIAVDGARYRPVVPYGPVEYFQTPMIPGARETAPLTTFGVAPVVVEDSLTTLDATTIAARQREGGGAPSERRPPRQGSTWTRLTERLRHVLMGGD